MDGMEIDRIDVLVFLGGILCGLDAAGGSMMDPLRMLANPRMVGRALDREIERNFDSEPIGRRVEAIEIAERAERWIDRGVSAGLPPNRPRAARRICSAVERIVRTLPIDVTDRMNRRQVHDVKAQVAKLRQPAFGVV